MGTDSKRGSELVEKFLALIPRDKVGEARYQEFVQHAIDRFTKVYYEHILTTPLIEVLHVNIGSDNAIYDDRKPCEVYGTVQVMFGEDIIFDLFNHSADDPETVPIDGSISIIIPKGCVIFPSAQVRMEIDLKDNARNNVQIAKGSLIWELEKHTDFEDVKTEKVCGEYRFAAVCYVTFQHAVIANLGVMLAERSDGDYSGGFDIYGSITAHYGTKYSSMLFEKKPNQAVTVKYGANIELSRSVLAVPAHSPVVIEANLWTGDGQQIVCKDAVLEFHYFGHPYEEDLAENRSIKVEVMWEHAYMLPPPQSTLKDKSEEASSEKKEDNITDKLGVLDQQCQLPFFSFVRNSPSGRSVSSIQPWPYPLMEVFSIVIRSFNDAASTIYGSVINDSFSMFESNQDSPVRLLPNQTIPIVYPTRVFMDYGFFVDVELNDVDGEIVSRGYIKWGRRYTGFMGWSDMKNKCHLSWFDRHLSSVIRGDKGYAAVHYMIISRGFQATTNVRFLAKSSSAGRAHVWGSLVSRYSNQKYPTHYEREYFRSKLLWKNQEEATTVLPGEQIPLSKSVVAVPINTSLIVEVNLLLRIQSDSGGGDDNDQSTVMEELQGFCLEFRTDLDYIQSPLTIEGQHCDIQMSIEWTGDG